MPCRVVQPSIWMNESHQTEWRRRDLAIAISGFDFSRTGFRNRPLSVFLKSSRRNRSTILKKEGRVKLCENRANEIWENPPDDAPRTPSAGNFRTRAPGGAIELSHSLGRPDIEPGSEQVSRFIIATTTTTTPSFLLSAPGSLGVAAGRPGVFREGDSALQWRRPNLRDITTESSVNFSRRMSQSRHSTADFSVPSTSRTPECRCTANRLGEPVRGGGPGGRILLRESLLYIRILVGSV